MLACCGRNIGNDGSGAEANDVGFSIGRGKAFVQGNHTTDFTVENITIADVAIKVVPCITGDTVTMTVHVGNKGGATRNVHDVGNIGALVKIPDGGLSGHNQ